MKNIPWLKIIAIIVLIFNILGSVSMEAGYHKNVFFKLHDLAGWIIALILVIYKM